MAGGASSDFYAENRRRTRVADAEWDSRRAWRGFGVDPELGAWAGELLGGSGLSSTTFQQETVVRWVEGLPALADPNMSPYVGTVADAFVQAAVRDRILVPPEPGLVALCFAHRDRVTEAETHLGWGFKPDAAEELVVFATEALDINELAGPGRPVGAGAVAGVVAEAARTLAAVRCGPVSARPRPVPELPATRWTGRVAGPRGR